MFENLANAVASRPVPKRSIVSFGPWSGGLVTEFQPEQMTQKDLYECLNCILVGKGIVRTRDGSTLISSGCTGEIVQVGDVKVGSTWYTIISDDDNKIYYDNSGTATAIATLEGEPRFCGFMGLLILFDGSYIKAWDGSDVFILYDNGTGATTPYQVTKRTETATTDKPLGNGTVTRVDLAFTSQSWDSDYTIPTTLVYGLMHKVGTPTGTVTAKIRLAADDSVLASKDISTTVADFTTDSAGLEYEAIFQASDITTEMSPNTAYLVTLEYSGGDAANYVNVKAVDASTPILSVKPGRPPKTAFGIVHDQRLFCIEGETGTNPAYVWYCNTGNHLDWSTSDGGGYVPAIDTSATNFPIGGIAGWYGSLYIFGTPKQPYLGQLSGASPSTFAINKTLQRISGSYKSIVVTADDIIFLHPGGVDSIATIQEYGELASQSQTDAISSSIQDNFSSAAVAGYDPLYGLYCLKMTGTDYTYVIHTRSKSVRYRGQKQQAYSPVARWQFAYTGTPTAFNAGDGFLYVGTDAGKIYKMDNSVVKDNSLDVTYKFKTHFKTDVFGELQAYKININCFGAYGGKFTYKFYVNQRRSSYFDLDIDLPLDDTLLTADIDILTAEANFIANPDAYFDREDVNFNFRTLMVGVEDIELNGSPLYFGAINLLVNHIGGF